ncbi:MAG: hypothetical protein V4649_18740 [Bacteroidota bacterium]
MKSTINWFEIPAADLGRAVSFYKELLQVEINTAKVMGTQMGFLPSDGINVSGAIVSGQDYIPSANGTVIFLNGAQIWTRFWQG